jgi:hypothetical protein
METAYSGNLAGIIKNVSQGCGSDADGLISRIYDLAEAASAYECQSALVGVYKITQKMRCGTLWFEIINVAQGLHDYCPV